MASASRADQAPGMAVVVNVCKISSANIIGFLLDCGGRYLGFSPKFGKNNSENILHFKNCKKKTEKS